MKSPKKFRKIANFKVLIGIVLASGLIIALGCNQKKLTASREKIYEQVEQMPEFPGGDLELRKFIANSLRYPILDQENGVQGKVFVGFVITKNGSVINTKIERSADSLLDAEALRVVKSLPKWKPGKDKGKKVAVHYTIPINFVLQ